MKSTISFFILIIFLFLQLVSCNVVNPAEKTPHFLHIDSVTFKATNSNVHGSISNKIADVWIYSNDNLLGAFNLPADIPILNDAPNALDIRAGVLTNGIQASREPYQFYKFYSTTVDWAAGTRKTIIPEFTYSEYAKFLTIEDFELGTSLIADNGDTSFVKYSGPEVFEGSACGATYVSVAKPLARSVFQTAFTLPPNKFYTLEMNYKCNVPIEILIKTVKNGVFTEQFVAGVNPKTSWNKIYFNIGAIVNSIKSATPYNIVIRAGLPKDSLTGYAFIDNVKLVGE
jgi:hypothetical protein